MHCFWNFETNQPLNTSQFRVKSGKASREYTDTDTKGDTQIQSFAVTEIFNLRTFRGAEGFYAEDIALLLLNTAIVFNSHTAPICINYNLRYEDKTVPIGSQGFTAGWGYMEASQQPSPILKIIDVTVVERGECKRVSPERFRSFITSDRFCAGNRSPGVSVCQGDSGGGLVIATHQNGRTKYFLRGIVSVGPANNNGSCDHNLYTTFTNVAYFTDFISHYEIGYRPLGGNSETHPMVIEFEDGFC